MVNLPIIISMTKPLHCCSCVLFVMFLAPICATELFILFTSDRPNYTLPNHSSCCYHVLMVNGMYICPQMDECDICLKKFQNHTVKITCCICSKGHHMKCITLCPDYIQTLPEEMNNGHCPTCLSGLFLHNLITDENDYISTTEDIFVYHTSHSAIQKFQIQNHFIAIWNIKQLTITKCITYSDPFNIHQQNSRQFI